VGSSCNASTVVRNTLSTTPAATAVAPHVITWTPKPGWQHGSRNFYRSHTSTWSSPCPMSLVRSCVVIRRTSTTLEFIPIKLQLGCCDLGPSARSSGYQATLRGEYRRHEMVNRGAVGPLVVDEHQPPLTWRAPLVPPGRPPSCGCGPAFDPVRQADTSRAAATRPRRPPTQVSPGLRYSACETR
jgi:hypothetical protein